MPNGKNCPLILQKDDIEDFIGDVRQIATQLGYPEAAQVMAIKGNTILALT